MLAHELFAERDDFLDLPVDRIVAVVQQVAAQFFDFAIYNQLGVRIDPTPFRPAATVGFPLATYQKRLHLHPNPISTRVSPSRLRMPSGRSFLSRAHGSLS